LINREFYIGTGMSGRQ